MHNMQQTRLSEVLTYLGQEVGSLLLVQAASGPDSWLDQCSDELDLSSYTDKCSYSESDIALGYPALFHCALELQREVEIILFLTA